MAMARAKAETTDEVARPERRRVARGTARPGTNPETDEDWETKMAIARARAGQDPYPPFEVADGSGPTPLTSKKAAAQPPIERRSAPAKTSSSPLPSIRR